MVILLKKGENGYLGVNMEIVRVLQLAWGKISVPKLV